MKTLLKKLKRFWDYNRLHKFFPSSCHDKVADLIVQFNQARPELEKAFCGKVRAVKLCYRKSIRMGNFGDNWLKFIVERPDTIGEGK